jgi:hypothetical protein
MRIVYLILCHKQPQQVKRLVERLQGNNVSFVIHVDKRSGDMQDTLERMLLPVRHVTYAKRFRCYWGRFNIVRATLSCMRIARDISFDYAVLLSGQDYPLKSNEEIESFLSRESGKEFIESFSLIDSNRWSGNAGSYAPENRAFCAVFGFRSRVWATKWRRRFPADYVPYGGSQWWCLSRSAVDHILRFTEENPSFVRYFRFCLAPDELFFQSILSNSEFKERICGRITYDDWAQPSPPYPKLLNESDFGILKNSRWLFARKFDFFESAALCDLIDNGS